MWDWDDHQHLLSLTSQKKTPKDHPGAAALNSKIDVIILLSHLVKNHNAFATKLFHPTEPPVLGKHSLHPDCLSHPSQGASHMLGNQPDIGKGLLEKHPGPAMMPAPAREAERMVVQRGCVAGRLWCSASPDAHQVFPKLI